MLLFKFPFDAWPRFFSSRATFCDNQFCVKLASLYFCVRCDECGRGFKVIKDLMKHKKKPHTAEYLSFKFPCPIDKCGKRFRKEVALKRHMLLHEGVRPFKCDHCDQAFHIKQV